MQVLMHFKLLNISLKRKLGFRVNSSQNPQILVLVSGSKKLIPSRRGQRTYADLQDFYFLIYDRISLYLSHYYLFLISKSKTLCLATEFYYVYCFNISTMLFTQAKQTVFILFSKFLVQFSLSRTETITQIKK